MPYIDSVNIEKFINSLNVQLPPKEDFLQLSKIFPINPLHDLNPNFERGLLLYALISKFKPKNVLEIGTAEGFSTLCMAWAMTDFEINGKIFTIDPKPFDSPIKRVVTWKENQEHETILLSTKDLWNKFAKKEWIEKIQVLTGFSGEILKKNSKTLPKMDMGFIDGHHDYKAVNHDFHAFLQIASVNFCLLFDDYVPDGNGGVVQVINEEVVPNFDVTLLKTNPFDYPDKSSEHHDVQMCWIESSSIKQPLQEIFPKQKSNQIIKEYVDWEKRWKLRQSINKKIPFLGKFRFNR